MTKKLIAILLSVLLICGITASATAVSDDYQIISPYADVVWEGDDAWGAYKGNLHTHSTVSDASVDYPEMIKEFYEQKFDFLAMTDHGITGKEWNKKQTQLPLYLYQYLLGYTVTPLTDDEFNGITSGTYPLYDGTPRGNGMVCVTGGNELNNMTLTKSHVNGFFLPDGVGDGFGGSENGFEEAVAFVEKNGGISHLNHLGDWLETNASLNNVYDENSLALITEIFLKYKSCIGMEVFNEDNGTTGYDRILWDNLLMSVLPYGRTIIGFSNGDTHTLSRVDSSFSVFMMKENTVENIKETMQNGAFFMVTRKLRANNIIGPYEPVDAMNTDFPYPMYDSVKVNGHKVSVKVRDCNKLQWIANGNIIFEKDITPEMFGTEITLDLDEIEGAENFRYIRCELFGEGGITLTQALLIDDGSEKLIYDESTDFASYVEKVCFRIRSTRIYVIFQELIRLIINEFFN